MHLQVERVYTRSINLLPLACDSRNELYSEALSAVGLIKNNNKKALITKIRASIKLK
jgi:hypothetical protein